MGAHLGWKMLWKGGAGQLGRFVFLFTSMLARSFSPMSEFKGSSIEAKCEPVKKYKQARKKCTSKPMKSPYGVGCYCDMAVSPTRSHLLCLENNFWLPKWDRSAQKVENSHSFFNVSYIWYKSLILSFLQRYTYRVLQTIQMKLIVLCVWAEPAVLGSTKTALKFKYEI